MSRNGKLLLDAAIIMVAVALGILAGPADSSPVATGPANVFLGVYFIYLGSLFLLSFYFPDACHVFRVLIWVCEHFSAPSGRYMAFFGFTLAAGIGGFLLLEALGVF